MPRCVADLSGDAHPRADRRRARVARRPRAGKREPDARPERANVAASLKVNGKGEALSPIRRADGGGRRVLAWGAVNARAPSDPRSRSSGSAGTTPAAGGSTARATYWKRSRTVPRVRRSRRCRCWSPPARRRTGRYWTVQAGSADSPLRGFEPWLPTTWTGSCSLATSRRAPELEVSRTGRTAAWQGCSGATRTWVSRSTASARTRRAFRRTSTDATVSSTPSTPRTAPGGSGRRKGTHDKGTGAFCHSFVPQSRPPAIASQDVRPAEAGERHRITVGGPGVLPGHAGRGAWADEGRSAADDEFNALFDKVMAGDRICAGER